MDLAKRISNLMEENDIKQKEIADKLDVTKGYVSRMCNGSKAPSHEFIELLSSMTGKSEHYILFGKEEYDNLDSLNTLINMLIEKNLIKPDGSMDDDIKGMINTLLEKEIKVKLEHFYK